MQVWAKRPLLSPKDKKLWPYIPLPKIHSVARKKRTEWRASTLYWGMLITRFPFSSGYYRYHTAVRCFLLLRRCDSIRSGIKSATILAFRNWPQKRNREDKRISSRNSVTNASATAVFRLPITSPDGLPFISAYSVIF